MIWKATHLLDLDSLATKDVLSDCGIGKGTRERACQRTGL